MPLHLIKLAVGCESVKELKGWVAERMQAAKKKGLPLHHIHITRMTPKRVDEVLAGGSLYWVIRAGSTYLTRVGWLLGCGFVCHVDDLNAAVARVHRSTRILRLALAVADGD